MGMCGVPGAAKGRGMEHGFLQYPSGGLLGVLLLAGAATHLTGDGPDRC
jgi:hypothetical protein